jgi:N-acetylmuramoyl-L-alanine amidase
MALQLAQRVGGRRRAPALFAAMLLGAALVGVAAGQGRASGGGVSRVRFGGDSRATRIVVELGRSARGRLLSEDAPVDAVVLALPGVDVAEDLQGRGMGLVRTWSVEEAAGAARLKLDLARTASVKRRFLLPPGDGVATYRYVIDLEAAQGRPTAGPVQGDGPKLVPAADAARRPGHRVVVIDAGHGGNDPGASGGAAREKNVTLAAARDLKTRLERTGRYRVVLTREADVYIPLEARVGLARQAGADLFISLHADAGPDRVVRGASVYTLSEKGSDRAARKVMNQDNWFRDVTLPGRDPAVNRILLDLTQRATKNRSAVFARTLVGRLDQRTALLQRSHRDAGFVVLLAPDVPAVLLEMGFITNPEDEKQLLDPAGRARLMDGVALAVDDYFEGEGRPFSMAALP